MVNRICVSTDWRIHEVSLIHTCKAAELKLHEQPHSCHFLNLEHLPLQLDSVGCHLAQFFLRLRLPFCLKIHWVPLDTNADTLLHTSWPWYVVWKIKQDSVFWETPQGRSPSHPALSCHLPCQFRQQIHLLHRNYPSHRKLPCVTQCLSLPYGKHQEHNLLFQTTEG